MSLSPTIHRFAGTVVARCDSVADAAAALAHAREHGLDVGLGGDAGLMIDPGPLKAIQVDPVRRIAWAQPGVVWGELDRATQAHGLAVTGARASSTRVVDHTLGSGSGWLERKLGLAGDNLRAARVLTAGGHVVKASRDENADLFWTLRGGGAGFGIVLELEFALRPVGPVVLGGMLLWPRDRAAEIMRTYRDLMAEAPDALCGGLVLSDTVGVIVVHAGDPGRGAEHIAPLRALAPALDTVGPMPYLAVQSLLDGRHADRRPAVLHALDEPTVDAVANAPSALLLQPLGGAFGRLGELETAVGHRDAAWAIQVLGPDRWVAPWARPEGPERRARLLEAKDRWDPTNVFL